MTPDPAKGTCPVCSGTGWQPLGPVQDWIRRYTPSYYSKERDAIICQNCGGQTMRGEATGLVPLRADGTPCKHEYQTTKQGRCYYEMTCKHCGHRYEIDSSD